jgi:hypothetical protein
MEPIINADGAPKVEPEGGASSGNEVPAWIAQLPDDLKGNETFTGYKTIGDLAKDTLASKGKVTELEGKLATDFIPKLAENATPEEKEAFYKALGRPDKPEEYELGKPENWPKDVPYDVALENAFRTAAHDLGISKDSAKGLFGWYNGLLSATLQKQQDMAKEATDKAAAEIKKEWGSKFNENSVIAAKVAAKLVEGKENQKWLIAQDDPMLLRLLLAAAPAFFPDTVPVGSNAGEAVKIGMNYDK